MPAVELGTRAKPDDSRRFRLEMSGIAPLARGSAFSKTRVEDTGRRHGPKTWAEDLCYDVCRFKALFGVASKNLQLHRNSVLTNLLALFL